jgi:hypothetical protein
MMLDFIHLHEPGANYASFTDSGKIQVKEFIDQYKNELDINKKNLPDYFQILFLERFSR